MPASATSDKLLLMGAILGAHGIKGEVKVKSFAAKPSDIGGYGTLTDAREKRRFDLSIVGTSDATRGILIARIAGVADRNAAEALKGVELYVDRDRLPPAAEGEFYHADLIGLAAVDRDGKRVGEIVAVQNYGAGDLLEIRLAGSGRTELIQFTETHVPEVDVAARRAVVVLPTSGTDEEE